jgi:hypothetical protein
MRGAGCARGFRASSSFRRAAARTVALSTAFTAVTSAPLVYGGAAALSTAGSATQPAQSGAGAGLVWAGPEWAEPA